MDLRAALAPPGVDTVLKPGIYDLTGTVRLDGCNISGQGATIRHHPANLRDSPAFILTGHVPALHNLNIVGPAPDAAAYEPNREGQHAIRIDGATSATIGNVGISNVYGDGIYLGTEGELAHGTWTQNAHLIGVRFDEIGRHAITPNAADGTVITGLTIGRVNLGVVDIEPPGHPWGCTNLAWTDSDINDSGGGFVLADKGVGTSHSVHGITLDGIRCHRRLFNVQVNPPAGTRRQDFRITNCAGAGVANVSPLTFRHVDGIVVDNVVQACAPGVPLVTAIDCTAETYPSVKAAYAAQKERRARR